MGGCSPDVGSASSNEMRVGISHTVETRFSTGKKEAYAYPQYRIVEADS